MIQDVTKTTPTTGTSSTSTTPTTGTTAMGENEFLKLLTYQLKAQNPLTPYDSQEFASQLAQFSQLEQLTSIRSLLEEQVNSNSQFAQSISNSAIPGMLGKYARVSTNTVTYNGSDKDTLGFVVPYNEQSGVVRIYDQNGSLVRTMDLSSNNLSKGNQTIDWDGTNNSGDALPSGNYSFNVQLTDANGATTNAELFTYGKISSVKFKSDGTYIVVNNNEIPFNQILEITSNN
jgi:flagellar basal-body rod modification protein FlgD